MDNLKCVLNERNQSEKVYISCDSNCMTLWKRENCADNKQISNCQLPWILMEGEKR